MNKIYSAKRLLAVFAHPDDESISMGGTLARNAQLGVDIRLISATRGEWGSISPESRVTRETLASVREAELRRACDLLGVTFGGFLDCPDGNVNHTFWHRVENAIVREIRRFMPHVVVTFGPDGLYWNSDHIAIGDITTDAFVSAGNPSRFPGHLDDGLSVYQPAKLYYVQYPDFLMRELARSIPGPEPLDLWGFEPENFGTPMEKITTVVDVRQCISMKMEAIRSHETQFSTDNIFSRIGEESSQEFLAYEYFRRVFPEFGGGGGETDLFEGICDDNARLWPLEQLTLYRNGDTIAKLTDKKTGVEI